ncbi:MAG: hypothetical protein P1V20_06625 [Verrucomicrobiales bacterium]|nr:hypothetical protein [Verrucomicrobiales bacterium]
MKRNHVRGSQVRIRIYLWAVGIILALLWLGFAVVSRDFAYDSVSEGRPFGFIALITGIAFAAYLFSVVYFNSSRAQGVRGSDIFLIAILIRLPLLIISHPVQEIDFYRYLWDGQCVASGISPYQFSPSDLDRLRISIENESKVEIDSRAGHEDGKTLLAIQDRSIALRTIFERIDHREIPTIYPLVSQVVLAIAAMVTPDFAPVFIHLSVLRALITVFDLGTVWLLILILRKMNLPVGRAIIYAWCPLVIKEFSNASHMDAIAVFFTVAAFYSQLRVKPKADEGLNGGRDSTVSIWLTPVFFFLAIFAKWYPVVIAPAFLIYSWRQRRWKGVIAYLPPIVTLGFVSFLISPEKVSNITLETPGRYISHVESAPVGVHDDLKGLRTFLKTWEMNDLIFSVVRENLRTENASDQKEDRPNPWYAISPNHWRTFWADLVAKDYKGAPDFLGAQLVCGGTLFLIIAWLSLRNHGPGQIGEFEFGRSIFLILAASWYLSATQNPWYWIWALPFLVFARSKVWLFVSAAALLYYARFWLIYQYPDKLWGEYNGKRLFDDILVWFEHLPILLALSISGLFRMRIIKMLAIIGFVFATASTGPSCALTGS